MNTHLTEHLDQSIELELGAARLYTFFHDLFPEDEDFWWQLAIEERNHAALLRNEKKTLPSHGENLPEDLLAEDLEALRSANRKLADLLERYKASAPSRQEAFQTALTLENSVGEAHFQEFMNRKSCSLPDELLRQLNQEDKDHERRIRNYMREHDIPAETQK